MVRRVDDSYLTGQAGGKPPAHEELEIEGPFGGFQTDAGTLNNVPPTIASDITNLDVLEGDLLLRPGTRELFDTFAFSSNTGFFMAINRLYDGVSEPPGDTLSPSRWVFFLWSQYAIFSALNLVRFGPPPGASGWVAHNSLCSPGTGVLGPGNPLGLGTASNIPGGGVVSFTGTTSFWDKFRLLSTSTGSFVNAFFKFTADPASEWRQITSASAGVITVSPGITNAHVDENYLIAIPLMDGSYPFTTLRESTATGATKIPLADPAQYYLSGWPGGTLYDTDPAGASAEQYQEAGDPVKYRANASIIKAGRLLISTDLSYDATLGTAGNVNDDPNTLVPHPGRIAWTRTNNIRSFNFDPATGGDATAGFIDDIGVSLGSIHDLFEMRGVTYALSERGIAAINETGNAYDPFRIRILISGKIITPRSKVQGADGRTAYFMATDGLYAFDGGSLSLISAPISEVIRGEYGIRDSVELSTKGALHYDDIRNRLYVMLEGSGTEFLVYDVDGGYWLKHEVNLPGGVAAPEVRFAVGLNWQNTIAGPDGDRQDSEMVVIGRGIGASIFDKLYSFERRVSADSGQAVSWSWFSGTLTFGDTRSVKTITRFRLILDDVNSPAALPITIDWFLDGGTTPAFSKTFDVGSSPVAGVEIERFVTFSGITATRFRFRLSAPSGDIHIKRMAITFKRRLENRQT